MFQNVAPTSAEGAALLTPTEQRPELRRMWPQLLALCTFGYQATAFSTVGFLLTLEYGLSAKLRGAINAAVTLGSALGMVGFGLVVDNETGDKRQRYHEHALLAALLAAVGGICTAEIPGEWVTSMAKDRSWGAVYASNGGIAFLASQFFAGVGIGGLFTMSAAIQARRTPKSVSSVAAIGVGLAIGATLEIIVALAVAGSLAVGPQWRVVFQVGSFLAVLTGAAMWWQHVSTEAEQLAERNYEGVATRAAPEQLVVAKRAGIVEPLLYVSASWFLVDCAAYGLTTVLPFVVRDALDGHSSYAETLRVLAIVAAVSAAAFAAGVLFVAGKAHDLASALVDTFKLSVPLMIIALLVWAFTVGSVSSVVALIVVGAAFSAPLAPLYAYPAWIAPREIRAATHGASAGSARFGALAGSALFYPAYAAFGSIAVLAASIALFVAAFGLASFARGSDRRFVSALSAKDGPGATYKSGRLN